MPGVNPFIVATVTPTAEQLKAARLARVVTEMERDGAHLLSQIQLIVKKQWGNVWENKEFTPAEVLAAMGTKATEVFRSAAILTAAVYQIGAEAPTPATLLDAKYLAAKLPYTAQEDGTITLNS